MFDFVRQAMFIQYLQGSQLSYFHEFFLFLRHFDSMAYYLIVGCFLVALLPRFIGVKYISLLCFSSYLNHFLKHVFDMPRPGAIDSKLDLINLADHFGFPSGAAMGSALIGCLIYRHIKSLHGALFAILYILLISLSRLYLGVHFPIDIIGGLFLGLFIWGVYLLYERLVEEKIRTLSLKSKALIFFASVGILNVIHFVPLSIDLTMLVFGLFIGIMIPLHPAKSNSIPSLFVAISGVLSLYFITFIKIFGIKYFVMFLLGLWFSFGTYYCSQYLSENIKKHS